MSEIGGYFGLDDLISNEYYKDLISLNSGRNALLYILKSRNINKLYIPYYTCDSIINMLKMNGYDYEMYNIDSKFVPVFNKKLEKDEYLYVINYYGQLTDMLITNLKEQFKNVIMDYTHAFFQRPIQGIDTLYTCRKFFGVPDGAYLAININIKEDLETDISKDRMIHILGRYEGLASEHYDDFHNNEKVLITEPIKYMSKLTHNILGAIDYEKARQKRNENYSYLDSKLSKYNKLKLNVPDGAFAYPFYINDGAKIRKELAKKKIYIPTLWTNVLHAVPEDSLEYNYASNILPLPCDQRYRIEDMKYIFEELYKFERKN
ncbi:hypothetical protein HMPREF1982_03586 [Clostridiales bacterium oral taxon 876 str. F0540]|nr:hypothetical protein HMPREF1982_03586 [Clostridiales bacterium oral taxon 876 str. F0540]